jgi:HEAT repeat protein/cyclophilin family peptidyl-prolyl cis-trans isomerase
MRHPRLSAPIVVLAALLVVPASAQQQPKPQPLSPADVDAIVKLVALEDTRRFDEPTLTALIKAPHPEVRRRAVQAVGRIAKPEGRPLLIPARADADPEVVATVAFATGQLKDADSIPWLSQILTSARTPAAVAKEAASALGKIRTPDARAALATYLTTAPATPAAAPVVGEALLAIGRFTTREDLAPIVGWTSSSNVDVRWRAAWALFRPRNPAAVPHLMTLCDDPSAEVRFWAVRGLAPAAVTGSSVDPAAASARLRKGMTDPDRRVRTEALRALVQYEDDASFGVSLAALDSVDTWLSVSAAEGMGRFKARADVVVPRLVAATAAGKPTSLRVTALTPLAALAPEAAADAAAALVGDPSVVARNAALQALQRLGAPGRAKLAQLAADPATKDIVAPAATARPPKTERPARTDAEYRRIVQRFVLPDYSGAPKPRVVVTTTRGEIEIELHAGDAPLGLEYLVSVVESGEIVGTEFGRVVPNFVAQQRPIRSDGTLCDEVSRRGLTRGNLSWASSGLDTGRPGYTLGSTPQPHNEGDFTALGSVVRGMDVVDRLELGDRITAARIVR